ncbi:MAG: argininosuccinate lyase [Gammaproteobacteria bacterium]|nr:argininosuccinate lyase [Gammaproteobacteria bacterium]MDE2024007.1 argininosuccinate lyase [Gammaproteobacteria bacterium]
MNDSAPQLWAKGLPLDDTIHRFTVGDDPALDQRLIPFDALGSAAHARMLAHAGLLVPEDAGALVTQLAAIAAQARRGEIGIRPEQEDCHTAIEALLTQALGDAGRRLHLGRSRNDQVALALRLYMRNALLNIAAQTVHLATAFVNFARAHAGEVMPGYTHLRRAMPSTFGLWAAAFAAGLAEELQALQAVYARLDRCPLGAAAGFGVPLPLDREYTAKLLGFSSVQISPVDVMNSRGRHELALVNELASIGLVMEKFLWDVALYSMPEFGFVDLPDAFTTGSSIMPQKRNPDVVELARGRCRELRGYAAMIQELAAGLPSSYHRDMQLLKRPLFAVIDTAQEWLDLLIRLVPALQVNVGRAAAACSDELYATHAAYQRVQHGVPFRDAYQQVAQQIADGSFDPDRAALNATHFGGAGNLGLDLIETGVKQAEQWVAKIKIDLKRCEENVLRGH